MASDDLKERVARVLAEEVAPALELEGAGLEVIGVTDGVVQLRLGVACAGCPITVMFLIRGIEDELRRRLPEVEYLEAVP
jgi:Fe-S cluster biogenesis protein NfuA